MLLVLLVPNLSISTSNLIKSLPKGLSTYLFSLKKFSKDGISTSISESSILIPAPLDGSTILSGKSLKISETGLFGKT